MKNIMIGCVNYQMNLLQCFINIKSISDVKGISMNVGGQNYFLVTYTFSQLL